MDRFSDVATDDLFTACVKSPLKLDLFSLALPESIFVLGTNKNTIRPKFKPSNNPTSAKFSDATRSISLADSWKELQWRWKRLGHGQDNKRFAGVGCVRVHRG